MEITDLALPGVKLLKPRRHGDARGWFVEHYSRPTLEAKGLSFEFMQDNVSFSAAPGTVRGLHFQGPPSAQTKLVSVLRGAVLDVVVDIRAGSPTYGRHVGAELSAENGLQMLAPRGVAHGFCTIEPDTLILYKVDAPYDRERDFGLAWDDPALGIDWPVKAGEATLSDKDSRQPTLAELPAYFRFGEA